MTENEALERHKEDCRRCRDKACEHNHQCIQKKDIEIYERLMEFEAIGTVEEFKTLKEKSVAKKVISFEYQNGHINYGCPICKRKIISKIDGEWCAGSFQEHCNNCGQKLDWD